MAMESYVSGVAKEIKVTPPATTQAVAAQAVATPSAVQPSAQGEAGKPSFQNLEQDVIAAFGEDGKREPSRGTIDATIAKINANLTKTRCAYSYDEVTKRITIKLFDDETDELIREVPPEKSLEALKKLWESAGILVDEKR